MSCWNMYNHLFNPVFDNHLDGGIDLETLQGEVGLHDMTLVTQITQDYQSGHHSSCSPGHFQKAGYV